VRSGVVTVLLNSIRLHPSEPDYTAKALMLLNALLTSGVHTKKEVISNGGLSTVVTLLESHTRHLALCTQACAALTGLLLPSEPNPDLALARDPSIPVHANLDLAISGDGPLPALLEVLRVHMADTRCVAWVCMALCKQCHPFTQPDRVVSWARRGIQLDIAKVLAATMRMHLSNPRVVEMCCRVILTLIRAEPNGDTVEHLLGAVTPTTAALQANPDHHELQVAGCKVLCELSRVGGSCPSSRGRKTFHSLESRFS